MSPFRGKGVIWVKDPDYVIDDSKTPPSEIDILKQCFTKYAWEYCVWGVEICPQTSRLHVDFYYETETPRKFSTELNKFNKQFGRGFGDLQQARGTFGENWDYSTKEDRITGEWGARVSHGQGERTDLIALKDEIFAGTVSVNSIMLENPQIYHQYGRTLSKIEDLALRGKYRTEFTQCTWYYGPTGTGKSHTIFQGFNPVTHYVWKYDKGWQDGYTGQDTVIINELPKGAIPYQEMLQLCDKFPFYLPRRNREPVPFIAKKILVSCSLHPRTLYAGAYVRDECAELLRRITIVHLDEVYSENTPQADPPLFGGGEGGVSPPRPAFGRGAL